MSTDIGLRRTTPMDRSSAATTDRAVSLPAVREPSPAADAPDFGPAALRALLAQLPVAVLMSDRDGRLVYANAVGRREVAALPAAVGTLLARALLTGEVLRGAEIELADPTGRRRWASVSVTPLADPTGEIEGAVLTMADVTDRKRGESWEPLMESLARL
jgi:PAS domain-containing protein